MKQFLLIQTNAIPVVTTVALIGLAYYVSRKIFHSYFDPLASFAGPPEAALSTEWLENTYSGFPEEEFERLHEKYQTKVLRVAPNELHISDVHQYKTIYSNSAPFLKDASFYLLPNIPSHNSFSEIDPLRHKAKRKLLSPFFSRDGVFKLENLIHEKTTVLINKIDRLREKHFINAHHAFRCYTLEIVMEFAFGSSANLIDEHKITFESKTLQAMDRYNAGFKEKTRWPVLEKIASLLPASVAKSMQGQNASFFELESIAEESLKCYQVVGNTKNHPVIFDRLEGLSSEEKLAEAMELINAGSDTTSSTLTAGLIHMLEKPEIQDKLADSLKNVQPDEHGHYQLLDLEKIDYLIACVKESLRVGIPVPGRLPRIVPSDPPFIVEDKLIPPGTIVSVSAYTMHFSEELWGPDARSFNPDRWMAPDARKRQEPYLCSFSKGTRNCVGQSVAYAELIILMANIFRRFKISAPKGYKPPRKVDYFHMDYLGPSFLVKFEARD